MTRRPGAGRHLALLAVSCVAVVALALEACDNDVSSRVPSSDAEMTTMVETTAVPARLPSAEGGGVEFYPAAVLTQVGNELAKGSTTGRTVGDHPTFHYVETRRITSGVPEVHDRWIDVTIVQSGRATLLTGGRVDGDRLASPGEHRGGTIVGGTPRPIAPGDLFVVPVGVPHQFQIARGDSIRYLTIKVMAVDKR
jgi:mannose-6-phosphate isomerase-like protein (cupin superfamily)